MALSSRASAIGGAVADSLVAVLASHLLSCAEGRSARGHVDTAAVDRAAEFLRANATRSVHSRELEAITGLSRFDLCAQFRRRHGTSPHRYLLMRRLEMARAMLLQGDDAASVAAQSGFADQPHLIRTFKSALGFTPRRYLQLAAAK